MKIFQLNALAAQVKDHANSLEHQIEMYTRTASQTNADIAKMHIQAISEAMDQLTQLLDEQKDTQA